MMIFSKRRELAERVKDALKRNKMETTTLNTITILASLGVLKAPVNIAECLDCGWIGKRSYIKHATRTKGQVGDKDTITTKLGVCPRCQSMRWESEGSWAVEASARKVARSLPEVSPELIINGDKKVECLHCGWAGTKLNLIKGVFHESGEERYNREISEICPICRLGGDLISLP